MPPRVVKLDGRDGRNRDGRGVDGDGREDDAFAEQFRERVRTLRERAGLTQVEMAKELGVKPPTYAKYEMRSLLPLRLIERFVMLTNSDLEFLLYGRRPRRVGPRIKADVVKFMDGHGPDKKRSHWPG